MPLTRRTLLKLFPSVLLVNVWSRLSGCTYDDLVARVLPAFLDTLMPADETPSATALQMDHVLMQRAENDSGLRRSIIRGCRYLEKEAQSTYSGAFDSISETQRIRIVEQLSETKEGTDTQSFFRRIQHELFKHYYAHPESWKGLGIDRPPQPLGYSHYDQSPVKPS